MSDETIFETPGGLTPEEEAAIEQARLAAIERRIEPFRAAAKMRRMAMRSAIVQGDVTDEEVDAVNAAVHEWQQGSIANPIAYTAGDPYKLDGVVWICRQSHTCTSDVEKPGPATLALWRRATPEGEAAWQPSTQYYNGTDGTHAQSVVIYENVRYKCLQSHVSQTGWEPPTVPALWEIIVQED